MNGCQTCGGFGNRHEATAHDLRPSGVPSDWWLDVVDEEEDDIVWLDDDGPVR